jgi:hypothetical protein
MLCFVLQYCDKKVGVHFEVENSVTLLDNEDFATIISRRVVGNEPPHSRAALQQQQKVGADGIE